MTKKLLALLIVMVMLFSLAACGGSGGSTEPSETGDESEEPSQTDNGEEPTDETDEVSEPKVGGQITIGNTTELSGDWVPYFQNNAADYDIYNFITGYSLVEATHEGEFVINKTVVAKDPEVTVNEDGSKTYTWTIKDGLTYSDGTPITAKDYVATIMLWSSSVIGEMGGANTAGQYFVGWNDFRSGESKVFPGVRLIDEKTFAFTIDAEYVPYFFELALVSSSPTKLSFWTDETVDIKDDGEGCYFTDNFTLEAYKDRINEARRAIPRPSTGPYVLDSYDEASKTAVLKINDKFIGNYEGQKPHIETIIYKKVTTETALDELKTGGVDLLTAMSAGSEIQAGLDLVESEEGKFAYVSYPRSGYGKLHFVCDFGPTQFPEVRQAIAYLLDRNDFAKTYTGGFGSVVNGPYGEAMWFYVETKDELNQKLNQYPYSVEKAIEVLEQGGWIYDENGNPYEEGKGVRHKKLEDGTLMPLVLEWAASENNPVSELLVVKLKENPDLEKVGIKINQTVMTFTELLNYLYRDTTQDPKYGEPTYNMFNLGTGFTPVYDLSNAYTIDPDLYEQGTNENYIKDEQLAKLAQEMVKVDPKDRELFKQKFVQFIERWNELLPDIPLYSNIYHDFFNAKLKNYHNNDLIQVVDALLYAYVEE